MPDRKGSSHQIFVYESPESIGCKLVLRIELRRRIPNIQCCEQKKRGPSHYSAGGDYNVPFIHCVMNTQLALTKKCTVEIDWPLFQRPIALVAVSARRVNPYGHDMLLVF